MMNRDQIRRLYPILLTVLSILTAASGNPPLLDDFLPHQAEAARRVSIKAVPSSIQVVGGDRFNIAVVVEISPGWILYSPQPGGSEDFSPIPARLSASVDGLFAGEPLWQADHPHWTALGSATVTNHVYTDKTLIFVPVSVPDDAPSGPRDVEVVLSGQICSDEEFVCLDLRLPARAKVAVGTERIANEDWTKNMSAGLERAMPAAELESARLPAGPAAAGGKVAELSVVGGLSLAVLAGLILNVMPCVLPVLPLRILSILEMSRQSRSRFVVMGLAFAGGVQAFFVVLAAVSAAVRLTAGESFSWGEHFQSQFFRVAMGLLIVAIAGNLFGLYSVKVPRRIADLDSRISPGGGVISSAGMGLILAVLSTPCSFAILAVALAWAQVQPVWLGSLAIVLMGVGMAGPHAILTAFPRLISRIPPVGRWTELLRQSMGFVLLLAGVWLFSTLSADGYAFWVAGYAVVLLFCLWMWGSWVCYDAPAARRLPVRGIAAVLAVVAGWSMLRPPSRPAVRFEEFSETRLADARRQGKVVLVKFTASWCLSCHVVERQIYRDPEVADKIEALGVIVMNGDVTSADMPASRLLYEELRGAPPVSVVYPPAGPPIRLEGKFSKETLFDALERALSVDTSGVGN